MRIGSFNSLSYLLVLQDLFSLIRQPFYGILNVHVHYGSSYSFTCYHLVFAILCCLSAKDVVVVFFFFFILCTFKKA